ncbi:hypothetical protein VKT23_019135 [Stygiomarasmius scandens]|uniref:Uncharacterized protein n=1 Tax=Marasmiellus scandens TaxID=2682957 RepID=A0ABR1IRJ5_9AGAR
MGGLKVTISTQPVTAVHNVHIWKHRQDGPGGSFLQKMEVYSKEGPTGPFKFAPVAVHDITKREGSSGEGSNSGNTDNNISKSVDGNSGIIITGNNNQITNQNSNTGQIRQIAGGNGNDDQNINSNVENGNQM